MYFQEKDLLEGLSKDFINEFIKNTMKETHRKGYILFSEGKRASHFYILRKGCVKLRIGDNGHTVYTVDQPGEAFGWSSLLGRDAYATSAECKEPTELLKIDVEKLKKILEKYPDDELIFFKHLAGSLGNRLLQTYKMISTSFQTKIPTSFGTGQVLESETTIA